MKTHGTIKSLAGGLVTLEVPSHTLEELSKYQDKLCSIEIKKDTKTTQQNRYIWLIIGLIDKKINGHVSDQMPIYCRIIEKAKIKTEYIQTIEQAKDRLKDVFRAVEEVDRRTSDKGVETVIYRCYYGTSTFTKKEMSDFIESLIDTAYGYGIDVKQYEEILRGRK